MGMLVDNLIVVVDGVLDLLDSGNNKYVFLIKLIEKIVISFLGVIFIVIIVFLLMYFMLIIVGEYIKSLFWVVVILLGLSWIILFI